MSEPMSSTPTKQLETSYNTDTSKLTYKDLYNAPLNISTYTVIVNLTSIKNNDNHEIDLHLLSRFTPVYDEKSVKCNDMEGCIIGISNYTEHTYTDTPRGLIKEDKRYPKSVFNNQLTILYKYAGFKTVNIKIFSNGILHLTGINDYPWEVSKVAGYVVGLIKNVKYSINMDKKSFNPLYNYVLYYNPDLNNPDLNDIEYYRNNVDLYNIKNYIEASLKDAKTGLKGTNKWLCSTEVSKLITEYIKYKNEQEVILQKIYDNVIINDNFSIQVREEIYSVLFKYRNLKSIKKSHIYLKNDEFAEVIKAHIAYLFKIFNKYEKRLLGIQSTDKTVICNLKALYPDLINTLKAKYLERQQMINVNDDMIYLRTDMSKKKFKLYYHDVEYIRGEYNTALGHKLDTISKLFSSNKYNIFNSYNPDTGHAGVLVSFYYNEKYIGPGYRPGLCYCDTYCCNKDKSASSEEKCVCITIIIFRPGNIIINSAKNVKQLEYAYNFIIKFIEDNKEHISYNIDNRELIESKEKKIIKKEPLFIERANVCY